VRDWQNFEKEEIKIEETDYEMVDGERSSSEEGDDDDDQDEIKSYLPFTTMSSSTISSLLDDNSSYLSQVLLPSSNKSSDLNEIRLKMVRW